MTPQIRAHFTKPVNILGGKHVHLRVMKEDTNARW